MMNRQIGNSQGKRKKVRNLFLGLSTFLFISVFMIVNQALAVPVYGTAASLTGNRDNNGGGLIGSNEWDGTIGAGTQFVSLEWDIVDNMDGTWDYEYTWSGAGLKKAISHFALDLTDNCVSGDSLADPGCVTGEFPGMVEFGDKDGIIGAVKFDFGGGSATDAFTYAFGSNRAPVWGDLCLKDGGGPDTCADIGSIGDTNLIWNEGFGNRTSEDSGLYVARPNGTGPGPGPGPGPGVIPEPSTVILFGTGLAGLGFWRWRKGHNS